MRKLILLILSTVCLSQAIKAQDVQPNYAPLDSFGKDTIAYLKHNWGTKTAGVYYNQTLGKFLTYLELPISDIEISINSVGEVSMVRFYIRNKATLRAEGGDLDKYSILAWLVFDSAKRPKLQQVAPHFSVLANDKGATYPWREEYRELMKDWILEDVQYNYGIFE